MLLYDDGVTFFAMRSTMLFGERSERGRDNLTLPILVIADDVFFCINTGWIAILAFRKTWSQV